MNSPGKTHRQRRLPLRPDASRGVALIAVLAIVSLLAVLAIGVVEGTRRHGQLIRRSIEAYQAQELADSAIRLALLELSAPPISNVHNVAAHSRTQNIFGRDIRVQLDYEAGRIDLNAADEYLLTAAFAGNGFPESEAREFAHRVIDWRDVDDVMQLHGAEREDYRHAGRASGPRNGPLETVTELLQVLGAEKVDGRTLDAFTVYSHSTLVRQGAAPAAVMSALRWANAQQLAGRTWLSADNSGSKGLSDRQSLASEVVRLRACANSAELTTCRVAIVRFTGSREQPVLVFSWRTHLESI